MKEVDGEVNRLFEVNGLQLLQKELTVMQHEIKLRNLTLKTETERLSRLSSQLQLTKQQIEFYTAEAAKAAREAQKTAALFTPELAVEMVAHQPHSEVIALSIKLLVAFDISDTNWANFTALLKDFSRFKSTLNSFNSAQLREDQMSIIVGVWKHSQSISSILEPVSRGANVLMLWLAHNIELKLKLESLAASQRRVPQIERKVKSQASIIGEQRSQIQELEVKHSDQLSKIEAAKALTVYPNSFNSISSTLSAPQEVNPTPRFINEFPNFNSEELYIEKEASIVELEGAELVGCCRSKFFCFLF